MVKVGGDKLNRAMLLKSTNEFAPTCRHGSGYPGISGSIHLDVLRRHPAYAPARSGHHTSSVVFKSDIGSVRPQHGLRGLKLIYRSLNFYEDSSGDLSRRRLGLIHVHKGKGRFQR
jgi:hypothetical protein